MSQYDFDLFVIGAGSGGVRASRIAASHGARVGICEESRVGGTCVIRGCVPKKLLVYASHFAEDFEDARGFGWETGPSSFSWSRLIQAKDKEIDRLNQVYLGLLSGSGVKLYEARGSFIDQHTLQVGGETVTAERILIATGGTPWAPDIPGIEHAISSNEAFDLKELPARVATVGGGFIACEFSGIFNGLGSSVTQIYRGDAVLRGFDQDVRRVVSSELVKKGIDLRLEEDISSIERKDSGLQLNLKSGATLEVDQVMYATGRVPLVRDLGLREIGVEVRADGRIVVDDYSRTSVEHIFAVGDVTSRVNLTPVAIYEGHSFADSEFGNHERPVNHEFIPSAVFSQPPVGTVGYTEEEAITHFGPVDVYLSEFRPMKHTLSGRDEKTLMKLIVEHQGQKVVGIHIVGPDAPEIVQGFAIAVKSGLTKERFDCTIGIHPTAAEELVTMRTPARSHG
ncbi:MAG: glutathione-disulfide reductase [Xanthomonadales bacterium]|nr:glutathione-disulfide reductase [Gammaproteobacteria bacterium]NND56742.1 glutathione-disulfide reductase [Xanthomonadales bacterium]NNK50962.1 glutathione-disulfide reductase [Xanthomonadales bacterium]